MINIQGRRVPKRVGIYLRVSTTEQTTTNQRRELHAVAKRHDWSVVQVFEDAGISGAKGRKDRPALDALLSLGRRRLEDSDANKVAAIKMALAAKRGVRRIARDLETGVGTVLRIKNELACA